MEHMKKLHTDGFFESFDFESFDACGTYLKMTKTLFIGQYWTGDLFNGDNTCWCIWSIICSGTRWFLLLHEFRRWFKWVYLMRKNSEKYLKWFKEFQHEIEIIVTRKSSIYDWIIEENIWVTSLANIIRVEELSHNLCLPKCHKCMECSSDIIEPCWTWWSMMLSTILPLYFWGLCFRDYRFYTEHNPLNRHHMICGLG